VLPFLLIQDTFAIPVVAPLVGERVLASYFQKGDRDEMIDMGFHHQHGTVTAEPLESISQLGLEL